MEAKSKKRLCWNCEGNVSIKEETCPYCGVSVVPASLDGIDPDQVPKTSFKTASKPDDAIFQPLYVPEQASEKLKHAHVESPLKDKEEEHLQASLGQFKNIFLALLLLLGGSIFFLFSLVLILFSQQGVFTLQWSSRYWYVYALISIPLLLWGWRTISKIDET